jgi:hypothetical protein
MGQGTVSKQAFRPPPPSYGPDLARLVFIESGDHLKPAPRPAFRLAALWLPLAKPLGDVGGRYALAVRLK